MNSKQVMMVMKNRPVKAEVFLMFQINDMVEMMKAWELSGVEFVYPQDEAPNEEEMQWRWIWSNSKFNFVRLANRFGKVVPNNLIMTMMRYNLIFPDGTSNWPAVLNKIAEEQEREDNKKRSEDANH